MAPVSVFSGLENSIYVLTRAVANAPIVSLEGCIGDLQKLEADGHRFGAFGLQAMAFAVVRCNALQFSVVSVAPTACAGRDTAA